MFYSFYCWISLWLNKCKSCFIVHLMRKFTCFLLGKYNILFLNTQEPKEPPRQEIRSFMYEDLKVYVSIVCILEIYNILCASCVCVCVCVRGMGGGRVSLFVPIKSNFLNVFNKTFWHLIRCMPNFDIFSLAMSSIPSPICVNDYNKVIQYLTKYIDYYTGRIFLSYNYVIN